MAISIHKTEQQRPDDGDHQGKEKVVENSFQGESLTDTPKQFDPNITG